MTVIVSMHDGTTHRLDRDYSTDVVAHQINAMRESGLLVMFKDNQTPSREFWIDPARVESVWNDGYSY